MLQFMKHCANLGFVVASSIDSSNDASCPVCATADIICGKWTILVIRDLAEGRSRFCELEDEGIVERHTFAEVPPRVEYSLTAKGQALLPLIEDMRSYGREWLGSRCGEAATLPSELATASVA
jgi:DNA-binding HxlR family transcriptional regulator